MLFPIGSSPRRAILPPTVSPTSVVVTDTGGVTIAMDNVTVGVSPAYSWTDDFESYADNDAFRDQVFPNYFFQEQNPGNIISLNTNAAFVRNGTQSVLCRGVSTEEAKADKCALVQDEDDFGFTSVFQAGVIARLVIWYFIEDPGSGVWPKNRHFGFEPNDQGGQGLQIKTTTSSGKWRIERGEFTGSTGGPFSNITPPGQSAIPVDQWVKIELRIKFGVLGNNAWNTFNADDDAWIQMYMDDVAVAEYSATTMDPDLSDGTGLNPTIGFDSVSNDATLYMDDYIWEVATGPIV